MKNSKIIAAALLVSVSLPYNVQAAEGPIRWGGGISFGNLMVNDPVAPSTYDDSVMTYSVIHTRPVSRNYPFLRWWLEGTYYQSTHTATPNNIGQSVSGLNGSAVLQRGFVGYKKLFRTWMGVGIGFNAANYSQRHDVDGAGFLINTYPDRSTSEPEFILNVGLATTKKSYGFVGLNITQHYASGTGVNQTRFNIFWLN